MLDTSVETRIWNLKVSKLVGQECCFYKADPSLKRSMATDLKAVEQLPDSLSTLGSMPTISSIFFSQGTEIDQLSEMFSFFYIMM